MSVPLRILHVEDSPDDSLLLDMHLREAGLQVELERVETADEMRGRLASQPVDVVLCDDRMPGFSAGGALEVMQERGIDVPFIVVSGTIGEVRAIELMRRGAHDYVRKGDLRRLVPVIERELREATHRAARRDAEQRKDQLLALIGHELRNPLAPIVTALDLLRLRGADQDREIRTIRRHVEHLQHLIDDLLDVGRITRGEIELRKRVTDVRACVNRAVEIASPLLEQKHHQLQIELPPEPVAVEGDPTRLVQLFEHLVSNAAKYTPARGHISVRLSPTPREAELIVQDDGVGIDPALLPYVFDAFVQGNQSLERSQGGLGLGLAIVKSLAELHGGSVAAENLPEGGSRFSVHLPRAESAPATPEQEPTRQRQRAPGGHRVLVVDDNVDAANLLAEFLGDLGYETRVAHDGPSALKVASELHPTLALLDIGLPVMDGYELGARLKREHGDLRMIAITGYGDVGDRRRSEQAGFEAHLVKPIDLERLMTALRA
jgi:signal transduction histidine kinase